MHKDFIFLRNHFSELLLSLHENEKDYLYIIVNPIQSAYTRSFNIIFDYIPVLTVRRNDYLTL